MSKWHMIIDVAKCENCNNCLLACKDEHEGNEWKGISKPQPRHDHRWMDIKTRERGEFPIIDVAYRPDPCMQCESAPCVKAGAGAVIKRPDGLVIIDPIKAAGRKDIVDSCPYKAIWWNEEEKLPQKCTFCAHLMDAGWKEPRCVQACPTGALRVLKADDAKWQKIIEDEKLEQLHPEYNTKPGVYYRNLYRFEKCFIAGTIEIEKNGCIDCAQGATVHLTKDGVIFAGTEADSFGDFKFDGLEEGSGSYTVEAELNGLKTEKHKVVLGKSTSMGAFRLA